MMNTPSDSTPSVEEIPQGTLVYDANGAKVGQVTLSTLRDGYFVVEKGWLFPHELFLPATAIQAREETWISLRLSKEELKQDQWKQPPGEAATSPASGSSPSGEDVIYLPPHEEEPPLSKR